MLSTRPLNRIFACFAALALLLAACAPPAAPQPTELAPAATPTALPPSATPAPPTASPAPTDDPNQAVTSPPNLGTAEPDPVLPPWAPQPGDDDLTRGPAYLDFTAVLLLESFPVQVQLQLEGTRPTPCHQLRVAVAPPDKRNQIVVEVYTLTDPGQACTQQLAPFTANVALGSYPAGTYTVLVNGEPAAEFTV